MRSRMITRLLVSAVGIAALNPHTNLMLAQETARPNSLPAGHFARAVYLAPALSSLQTTDEPGTASNANPGTEASPSDQSVSPVGISNVQQEEPGGAEVSARDSSSQVPSALDGEMLAPLQSRLLTLNVHAVSTSNDNIGTGLVPKATRLQRAEQDIADDSVVRDGMYTHVYWQASLIQHYPLYFEDAMLERHGHAHCCRGWEVTQSVVSGAKFFGTIAFLPYLRSLQPKHECVYALGHYRAGSAAPCLQSSLPYDRKAAFVGSASAAAFFWAAPL